MPPSESSTRLLSSSSNTPLLDKVSKAWRPGRNEYVLLLLMVIFSLQYLDRQIVVILAEPLKQEFGMSDSMLGLLAGLVFSVPYALMLLPVGYLVDRVNRRNLLAAALSVWSLLTVLTGLSRTLIEVMICRATIAASESVNNPAALSMLSDHYSRKNRASAIGVYYAGPAIATILGFTLIGVIADRYGWRTAFFSAGVPGILLALLLLLSTREPQREKSPAVSVGVGASAARPDPAPPLADTLRFILSQKSLCHMLTGMTLTTFVAMGQIAWLSPLLMRAHGLSLVTAAIAISFAFGLALAIGQIAGGFIVDRLARRNIAWTVWFPAICAAIACMAMIGSAIAPQAWLAIALLACWALPHGCLSGPVIGTAQSLVAPRMRGVTNSCMALLTNLVGAGLGPLAVGMLSDRFDYLGDKSVVAALILVALFQLWAVVHFSFAARTLKQDMARAEVPVVADTVLSSTPVAE